ncbi:DUF7261 family protein [Halegenticoccus tardaugens]|uniref:DUF7261 family protein n=1 Tax=Halegenticoccus tardaugens TaxID=2071624 RepID=UPI00100C1935|nr:hypothetical protein [Halegenticoccus tardaugens]
MSRRDPRGQLVLVAAVIVAIALVPMVVAYVQLGYHADVDASAERHPPGTNAERALDRAVHNASTPVIGEYDWDARSEAVDAVNRTLDPGVEEIEAARVDRNVAYEVERNGTAAETRAADDCPSGPKRDFGPCRARGGVVVQERADETHVLAVALDVRVTTESRESALTFVFETIGG